MNLYGIHWLLVLSFLTLVKTANILCFFSLPSTSHQIVYQVLWKELSLRGHTVTVVTPNPINDPTLTNLTEIDVSDSYEVYRNATANKFSGTIDHWSIIKMFDWLMFTINEAQFRHPKVKELLEDDSKEFDVLLTEPIIVFPIAFSFRFKCPWISVLSMDASSVIHSLFGNPHHPIMHSNFLTTFEEDKTILERVDAVLFQAWYHYHYHYEETPKRDKYLRKYFGKDMPYFGDMLKNASMLLLNVDPIIHKPRALQPNVVVLGGRLHIKPEKPLPKDLKSFLDSAKEGVIYFSFGTNVRGSAIDKTKRKIFLEAFSELPYKVLWKFEEEYMENKPHNVKISKWLPQQDVLGHPRVKLFITQGGFQSLEEAIVKKVPLLAMPFLVDQFFNSQRISKLGIGKACDIKTLTKEELKDAILEIIENPKYKEEISKISRIGADQPTGGLEKAVWWTEYVIRHGGAKYLKNNDFDFSWYRFLLLDVIGFLFTVIFVGLYVLYKLLKLLNHFVLSSLISNKIKVS